MDDAPPDVWGLGEYERVAERLMQVAEVLVDAAGVAAGLRVCDVAAGTGNVSAVAARLGAIVTASDLSPRMVALGRARTEGLDVTWQEADAQDLPFEDGGFDVALSCFGAMFAPDQRKAASELLRVVAPSGVAAMTGWVPEGPQAAAMAVMAAQSPERPPVMNHWGDPDVARGHFEAAGATSVEIERRHTHWEFATRQEWLDFVERGPGPMVLAQAEFADRWPAIREEMLACLPAGEPFVIESPYLVILARR